MAAAHKQVELADVIKQIQDGHNKALATAAHTMGACLRIDPQTGQTTCTFTDTTTCQNIGGTFIGGPCGS